MLKKSLAFTAALSGLLNSDISLKNSLTFMEKMTSLNKDVRFTCSELSCFLEEGSMFSIALEKCSLIKFSKTYIAFAASAEESGMLKETFSFLHESLQKKYEDRQKILASMIYPVFVFLLAIVLCSVFIIYAKDFTAAFSNDFDYIAYKNNAFAACIQSNLFLLICICSILFLLRKFSLDAEEVNAFRIAGFLTARGLGLFKALKISMLAIKNNNKLQTNIASALLYLEEGKSVLESSKVFGKKITLYLELADFTGDESKVFLKLSDFLQKEREKKEKMFSDLIEPGTLFILSFYILILIKALIMPVMFVY